MTTAPRWTPARRLGGLRRFALAITILNVWGHTALGFEQSWVVPFLSLAVTYGLELSFEALDARAVGRRPRFAGGAVALVDFLLPAHITGLAVGMLLYTGERYEALVFASAFAIASKTVLRVPIGPAGANGVRPTRHFMNPSNFAVSATLFLFPWITGAPPYQFVANVTGAWDWALPGLVLISGSLLNTRFTGRLPLAAAWVGGFVLQALIRAAVADTSPVPSLAAMSGLGFVLYTFYMVTDPATTPERPLAQVAFGGGVALVYGLLVLTHHVFGFYYALTIVSLVRGLCLWAAALGTARRPAAAADEPLVALAVVQRGSLIPDP